MTKETDDSLLSQMKEEEAKGKPSSTREALTHTHENTKGLIVYSKHNRGKSSREEKRERTQKRRCRENITPERTSRRREHAAREVSPNDIAWIKSVFESGRNCSNFALGRTSASNLQTKPHLSVACFSSSSSTPQSPENNTLTAESCVNLGLTLFSRGRVKDALVQFETALSLDPNPVEAQAALYNKACCHSYRVWNYEDDAPLNAFDNHQFPEKGISKLCLVNELDDSLLLVASCDGNIRIWKDYTVKGKQKLVTAFSSIQGHKPGARGLNVVVDWQQQSGYLYASGEISSIMVWDLDKEQLINSISSSLDCSVSAISASHLHGGHFAAGFGDGSVRLYDVRTPDLLVRTSRPDNHKVLGIGFQPGLDPCLGMELDTRMCLHGVGYKFYQTCLHGIEYIE